MLKASMKYMEVIELHLDDFFLSMKSRDLEKPFMLFLLLRKFFLLSTLQRIIVV